MTSRCALEISRGHTTSSTKDQHSSPGVGAVSRENLTMYLRPGAKPVSKCSLSGNDLVSLDKAKTSRTDNLVSEEHFR
jgi:hypothetical protein